MNQNYQRNKPGGGKNPFRLAWYGARNNACRRGIVWALSYEDFCRVWGSSGCWGKRGKRRGEYQMDRKDNSRGYTPDNVQIISGALNRVKDSPHGHQAKLTEEQVAEIRLAYKPRYVTYQMLAARYGVARGCIKMVLRGQSWAKCPVPASAAAGYKSAKRRQEIASV